VRAKMVLHPADWPWSSYRATLGIDDAPPWLQTGQLLAPFASAQSAGRLAFADFVMQGIDEPSPLRNANSQLVLGDSGFCDRVVGMDVTGDLHEVRSSQRRAIAHTLTEYFAMYPDPKMAMARAYLSMGHSMPEIARFCGMSVKTVSRAVKRFAELDDAY